MARVTTPTMSSRATRRAVSAAVEGEHERAQQVEHEQERR
jgi:hypothetical protein